MHPIHDVDAQLLLAITLASKRRPAELVEIIAATDLLHAAIPAEQKLIDAFQRLSVHGLIATVDGGFTLLPPAETIMGAQSKRNVDVAQRIQAVKSGLGAYKPTAELPALVLTTEQLGAAILAHRAASKQPLKNLLVPKPKAEDKSAQRPGQRQRKPLPARRRKP